MSVNTKFCPSSANVRELKVFLKQHGLSNAGNKQELVQRCCDYLKTEELEEEIDARVFVDFLVERAPGFDVLPMQWTSEGFPVMQEHTLCSFLKAKGAYTKNYKTGLRLCQCGHLSHIQKSASQVPLFLRARCRPTMKRQPPHYECFIQVAEVMACNEDESTKLEIEGANCHCPAGETQSCVHIAALLLTLAEITPKAGTSKPCAWSRPSWQAKAQTSAALDFGHATSEGYKPYTGPLLDTKALLASFDKSTVTGSELFHSMEEERAITINEAKKRGNDAAKSVLRDPIDYLLNLDKDVLSVDDLVSALAVSHEEVKLIAEMTTGQRENPLWMDARQWRVTEAAGPLNDYLRPVNYAYCVRHH